jgi:hypothetical protein
MTIGHIDLKGVDHIDLQARGGGIYDDKRWRESYFFNVTDPRSGVTLITTIGMLPNRKRTTGFLLIMKDGKALMFKLLAELKRPRPERYRYKLKGLEYSVEGAGWRIRFRSRRCDLDVLFTPLNRVYAYMDEASDGVFKCMGSQHYEQFGTFEGAIVLDGATMVLGPCFGHRDHSWGLRDWAAVDRYRLFCMTFHKDLAINLWEGRIGDTEFTKGYVYDGVRNTPIVGSKVVTRYRKDGRIPERATITVEDKSGREHVIRAEVLWVVPFPLKGSVLYETVTRMRCGGMEATGLLEYLYHEERTMPRLRAYLRVLGML